MIQLTEERYRELIVKEAFYELLICGCTVFEDVKDGMRIIASEKRAVCKAEMQVCDECYHGGN